MTTGGGWQDQAGGIFPGAKLLLTGPGLEQRLRVQPVSWMHGREAEFESLLLLYYTGVRRVARDLLRQVVGRYLARETACLQVLHSIRRWPPRWLMPCKRGNGTIWAPCSIATGN